MVSPTLSGRVLVAAAVLALAAPPAAAQTYTWNQTASGNWSTATWTGGTPVSGVSDVLNFNGTAG